MTVRDLVSDIQRELLAGDVEIARGRELAVKLTALLSNVLTEQRSADAAFAVTLLNCLQTDEAANRARIRAETSPEYARKREAADLKVWITEMIRVLKENSRSSREEMQLTR